MLRLFFKQFDDFRFCLSAELEFYLQNFKYMNTKHTHKHVSIQML